MTSPYSNHFYSSYVGESQGSASVVAPWLIELFHPKSVVDIGCGIGTWLSEFKKQGISELRGFDGNYVQRDQYLIEWEKFTPVDLQNPPTIVSQRYDLACCMEVAEHISESSAEHFIDFLCSLSDIIVFSAAIPLQGGTSHVNEQWQSYWANKFIARGYGCSEALKKHFWNNPNCAYYYSQNGLIFIKDKSIPEIGDLLTVSSQTSHLDVVHPAKWMQCNDLETLGMKKIIKALPSALRMAIRKRIS